MLPNDPAARKGIPLYSGLIQYFPAALVKVAEHSVKGNRQHNPGCVLFHDRSKSGDELDALVRHLFDDDLVSVAWRALAALQKRCEAEGAPIAPAAGNVPKRIYEENHARKLAEDRPLVTDVFKPGKQQYHNPSAAELIKRAGGIPLEHAAGGFMFAPERD